MTIILAEGESFNFVLVAQTRKQADQALHKAWSVHQRQTGAGTLEDAVTVNYIDNAQFDVLYRDYEPVKG